MLQKTAWRSLHPLLKVAALLAVSALIAIAAEILCNYQALVTAGLKPTSLNLEDFTWSEEQDIQLTDDGAQITLPLDAKVDLEYNYLDTSLHTVSLSFLGQGTVHVSILVMDSASEYEYQTVYSIACVAQDARLRQCTVPVYSADLASALCIRMTSTVGDVVTLESVSVNNPIAFVWEPTRMLIILSIAFLILCALFLRGVSVLYDPRKRTHRLILILPLVILMVFTYTVAAWIAPWATPLYGITDEEALASKNDAYAVLFETLRNGRLSLEDDPGRNLLSLSNPYDMSERIENGAGYRFDFALYNQKYYVYFGLAPILTVYTPFHWFTGRVPSSRDACLLLGWLTIAMIGWAVCGLARRYLREINVFALSLCCVTAVLGSGALMLVVSADFYYLAELSFVCFASSTIALGIHAVQRKRGWISVLQYALCGVSFVLALMSRANGALMLVALLAPIFFCALKQKSARLREAMAFLLPAAIGLVAQCWYNAARFGSILDFGITSQLTVTDVHYRAFSVTDIPRALYHYLLEPIIPTDIFPYVNIASHTASTLEHFTFLMPCAGILAYPLTWALAAMPYSALPKTAENTLVRQERRWVFLLPIAVSLLLMVVTYSLAGVLIRYACDFNLFYILPAAVCILPFMTHADTRERKILCAIAVALCCATVFISLGLVFQNERNFIEKYSPQVFYGLQRMFFPY